MLFHITSAEELRAAGQSGTYTPTAFDEEGFVHCSYAHQVAATANRIFRGRSDLVVLEVDPARLHCPVIDENLEGGAERFPHVYGPLPLSAVVQVHRLSFDEAGGFAVPAAIERHDAPRGNSPPAAPHGE
jgi:uncharacterized protein (DUF952 family)